MQTNVPSVETIMNEIRSGLDDTMLSDSTIAASESGRTLQSELRKAAGAAALLGRCGGSLRGRLCRLLAAPARPVVEQLDLFHAAVCGALGKLAEHSTGQTRIGQKVDALEKRLLELEAQPRNAQQKDVR